MHDFGSTPLIPHTSLNPRSDSWNAALAGPEIPTRIYAGAERRVGRGSLETHTVQVLNEPRQILALQV